MVCGYVPYDEENVDYWREEQGQDVIDVGLDYLDDSLPNNHIGTDEYLYNELIEFYELQCFLLDEDPKKLRDLTLDTKEGSEKNSSDSTNLNEKSLKLKDSPDLLESRKKLLISDLSLNQLKHLEKHKNQMMIGEDGEDWVYKHERNKLHGTKYYDKIDESKAYNEENGYDILSYTKNGTPLHIEVKATQYKDVNLGFHLTPHQKKVAKDMKNKGMKYIIYFIEGIYSNKPKLTIIEDILETDKYEFDSTGYWVTRKY